MAVVQGIREKVHLPIYDSLHVERGAQLIDVENSSTLKFFVDVQRKTKLETNLQSASLLPHYNTFEARAMRVVISDLPPVYSEDVAVTVVGDPATPELKTDLRLPLLRGHRQGCLYQPAKGILLLPFKAR